jgi:polysaccharide deacetylase 2 family uncharacterized protein YibQ
MARGFLTGALSGTVIAAGIGAVASVIAPAPSQKAPINVAGVSPAVALPPARPEQSATLTPQAEDPAPAIPTVVLGLTPDADTLAEVDQAAQQPARAPRIAALEETSVLQALITPEELPVEGAIEPGFDDPVTRGTQNMLLVLPAVADRVDISTEPAALPEPELREPLAVETTLGDEADTAFRIASLDLETLPAAPVPARLEPAPARVSQPAAVAQETADARLTSLLPASIAAAADAPAALQPLPPPGPPTAVNRPQEVPSQDGDAGIVLAQATPAVEPAPSPKIGKPARSLTERSTGVVVNRPATTTPEETPQAAAGLPQTEAAPETVPETAPESADLRPVDRYKQAFENAEGKPLMSIVLIDSGAAAIGAGTSTADLRDFPYPLSFAVDSTLPDAQERIAMYRAEGFEVLGMIDLPPGAQATDAETTLGVLLPQMGEVVGVLEGPGAGLQETREVSDQVTAILAASGHGLVAQAKGLNTMPNIARKEGVPAAAVFRDFDGKGQDERVIRRFLDQAAFKAGQDGAVIMLGRLQPETIAALLVWGLQDRAGQVALAPVSAVLLCCAP